MPMDRADFAQDITELHIQKAIGEISTKRLPFSGYCICCAEPVFERRFCDSDCREIWENTPKHRRMTP